jgi:hypothetical protein
MVPYEQQKITFQDIETLVSSGEAKLIFDDEHSIILRYITNVSTILQKTILSNPPLYSRYETGRELDLIQSQNGIYIYGESVALNLLSDVKNCKNYVYITLEELMRVSCGLIIRKQRVDILESMNVVFAERMSFVDDYIRSYADLSYECRKDIFPVYTSDPKYEPLLLVEFSGTFVFLFALLFLAFIIFLLEIFDAKSIKTQKQNLNAVADDFQTFKFVFNIDDTIRSDIRRIIYAKCMDIVDVMQKEEE